MQYNKIKRLPLYYPHALTALLCAVIVFASNYLPNPAGAANNGDFLRVMHPNKIAFIDDNPRTVWNGYGYTPEFIMQSSGSGGILGRAFYFAQTDFTTFNFPSSQILFIKLSKFLCLIYNILSGTALSTYNLFWMFLINLALFSCALYLILGYVKRNFSQTAFIALSFTAVFVLCDHGYTIYFNSFYGEGLQYVLTLLVIGLLLRLDEHRGKSYIPYYIAVYLMATSKFAWLPVGVLFAVIPPVFPLIGQKGFNTKKLVIYSFATVCVLVVFYLFLIPSWIDRDTNFNAVFNGILRNSDTPREDLLALGLDPGLAVLQGREMYQSNYPVDIDSKEFEDIFYNKISKTKILKFYLTHPARFLKILEESAGYAKSIRAPYLTSVMNPAFPGEQAYRFSFWESIRAKIGFFSNFYIITIVLAAVFIVNASILVRKKRLAQENAPCAVPAILCALAVCAAFSFILPYISNGVSDEAKQLFGFISLFDFILCGVSVRLVELYKLCLNGNLRRNPRQAI